jgi:hypothetical protein
VKRAFAFAVLCSLGAPVGAARADEPAASERSSPRALAAERLFTEGRALLTKHRFKDACEKLAASEKLDPAVGTLVSLGECNAGMGRTASAWLAYRAATALATERHDPRRAGVEERAAAIEPQISNIAVHLTGDAAGTVQISIDGESVGRETIGAPMPIDPGPHTIVAAAPGFKRWSSRIRVETNGDTIPVEVPPLEPLPDASVVESARRAAATKRTIGLAAGAVGLVGLGVGLLLGEQAIVKIHDANDLCPSGPTCANQAAVNENQTGKGLGNAASVIVPASVVVLGAGAFLVLTTHGPRPLEVGTELTPGGARVRVGLSW